ncbi:DNA binding domain-containing protein, excisionase family [Cryobacterium psychrotolerans]|uniref:DNA binding domain-containing protein, excisionase family n=1 Tax=Cryobacterium psychrotolerans TaxID=386301 RepID=A0A1G9E6H9_9MICO|nr:helix-turn-helix domain-containing protein [Cryobacterium psychrotolerans]TFD86405.1 DNA-binding protein [Cryobacterium psychrotolerans]SDK71700.1 DNA binding domain-containing protein, excisionase family [Cryobacterium psychrotolerans]
MSKTNPTPVRWFNTAEAAAYLGMSERQVIRARQSRKLGCTRLGGNLARHTQEQLDAYIDACTVAPTTDAK